jgi:tetratricopeptide (TPR) repeat protein
MTMGITAAEAYDIAEHAYDWFDAKEFRAAETVFLAMAIICPSDAYMRLMLGSIYFKQEREDDAIRSYTTSIELEPVNIAAFTNRGELYLQRGKFKEALADLRQAISLDKKGDDPHALRARALASATIKVIEDALKKKKGGEATST